MCKAIANEAGAEFRRNFRCHGSQTAHTKFAPRGPRAAGGAAAAAPGPDDAGGGAAAVQGAGGGAAAAAQAAAAPIEGPWTAALETSLLLLLSNQRIGLDKSGGLRIKWDQLKNAALAEDGSKPLSSLTTEQLKGKIRRLGEAHERSAKEPGWLGLSIRTLLLLFTSRGLALSSNNKTLIRIFPSIYRAVSDARDTDRASPSYWAGTYLGNAITPSLNAGTTLAFVLQCFEFVCDAAEATPGVAPEDIVAAAKDRCGSADARAIREHHVAGGAELGRGARGGRARAPAAVAELPRRAADPAAPAAVAVAEAARPAADPAAPAAVAVAEAARPAADPDAAAAVIAARRPAAGNAAASSPLMQAPAPQASADATAALASPLRAATAGALPASPPRGLLARVADAAGQVISSLRRSPRGRVAPHKATHADRYGEDADEERAGAPFRKAKAGTRSNNNEDDNDEGSGTDGDDVTLHDLQTKGRRNQPRSNKGVANYYNEGDSGDDKPESPAYDGEK